MSLEGHLFFVSRPLFDPHPLLRGFHPCLLRQPIIDRPVLSHLLLRLARYDLDLLRVKLVLPFHLEVHVLDDEGPDFVAEAVGVEMSLHNHIVRHFGRSSQSHTAR